MQTISVSNNKGGSGKTTTTVSLAAAFAERGFRVLVVDLDPQGSATVWLGGQESPIGLVEYSTGGIPVSQLVVPSTAPGVDLIPASPSLVPPEGQGTNETGFAIVRALRRLPDYWDLVLIDTSPTLGYLSLAPLVPSHRIVIPVEAHALGLSGVTTVITSIERARRQVNPRLELLGIVPCRTNTTLHQRGVIAELRARFGPVVLEHGVREAIQMAAAPAARLPITRYAGMSGVAQDCRAVADELLDRMADLRPQPQWRLAAWMKTDGGAVARRD